MAGIPQTIAALSTQMQNLAATLEARTGAQRINLVTAPEYGADPTGAADSTAAFAAALAGPSVAMVPPGLYRLNNLVVPSGACLVGTSTFGYAATSLPQNTTILVALNGSTSRVINVDGKRSILISGLEIDCDSTRTETRNTGCDGISAGGHLITLRDVTVRHGRYGIGGAVTTGSNLPSNGMVSMSNCQVFNCATGIGDLVDAWLTSCYLSSCGHGAVFTTQSGSVSVVGCRVEWNTGDGIRVENASDTIVSATLFDRNHVAGLYLAGAYKVAVSGCDFRRNGRNLDANSCHIRLLSASNVTVTGCTSRHMADDDGSGPDAPAIWVRELGTSWNVSFVGNDLKGVTGADMLTLARFWSGNLPNTYTFSENIGLELDERTGSKPMRHSGFAYHQFSQINVVAASTGTVTFTHDPFAAYTGLSHKLRVSTRNQSTGAISVAEFTYLIQREGGAPTITQSAAMGTIGTAGVIAFGSGTVRLSWTGIAADASAYTLSIQNTSASDVHFVTVQVY